MHSRSSHVIHTGIDQDRHLRDGSVTLVGMDSRAVPGTTNIVVEVAFVEAEF